jgi:hypothetical protein
MPGFAGGEPRVVLDGCPEREEIVRQRRVFHIMTLALCLLVAGGVALVAQGQKPQAQGSNVVVEETRSEVARGGTDSNIKVTERVNAVGKDARQAPPAKGGEKPRGAAQGICDVHFDNRSPWWIHVYVDGEYEGVMPPWGDVYTYAIAGPTRLYGRAEFDDGSRRTWGPVTVRCPTGGSYSWRLLR